MILSKSRRQGQPAVADVGCLPQLQTNPRTRFVRSHNQSMPTWDEPKRMRNIKVHGLDFMYGARRYSPDVLQDFKATGAGWQTCMIQYVSVERR